MHNLDYSIVSGKLYRDGVRVDSQNAEGYKIVYIGKVQHYQHRVIWKLVTGDWPKHELDHEDQNKANNAWLNLREATRAQNSQNKKVRSDSKLQVKGVVYQFGKYRAHITVNRKMIHLGTFSTVEEAAAARKEAELRYHSHASR
jgi:HNH endonuclease